MRKSIKVYFDGLSWDKIEWAQPYSKIRRIQRRIYKASRLGETKKVWFLQKQLITSPHAKLIAVQIATTLNKGKSTPGIDVYLPTSTDEKLKMAKMLEVNGKSNPIKRVWITKPRNIEKRPLGISTIQDRAKQALCKLALEPEWEAKFESNSYGFRPGRRPHDAIEAIFLNLRHNTDKLVFDADIRKCFDKIDHDALLAKIQTFHLMETQIKSWLVAGVFDELAESPKTSIPTMGTPQGGIISPLLCNIALHGLENHLTEFVENLNIKPHPDAATGKRTKRRALGFIRYADDFVIIHQNPTIMNLLIKETENWLSKMGLEISSEKSKLKRASQSFNFLGFQIAYVVKHNKFKVKIVPSKKNCKALFEKTRQCISRNKASSAFKLITKLRPILLSWGNYFKYCECSKTFMNIDNVVYQQIRAWVFRRAVRQGRNAVKQKYFPENRTYKFQGRVYNPNWILNGVQAQKSHKKPKTVFLPKIQWIKSENYVKVKGNASVYDGNHVYWVTRTSLHSIYSTRVKNLIRKQNSKCSYCKKLFTVTDIMEVDHKIPRFKGGKDAYDNLQLLHAYCHKQKTKEDQIRVNDTKND
jgi:RNA-directed DNA polymerase